MKNQQTAIFITRSFSPMSSISSIRMSKLVKYLLRNDWQVTVFCEEPNKDAVVDPGILGAEPDNLTIIRLPSTVGAHQTNVDREKKTSRSGLFKRGSKLHGSLLPWVTIFREILSDLHYLSNFRQSLNKHPEVRDSRLIFSSFRPLGTHLAAAVLVSRLEGNEQRRWVADFRDLPLDSRKIPFPFNTIIKIIQNHVVRKADIVTVISEGLKERLCKQLHDPDSRNKVHVLYNGFDPEDMHELPEPAGIDHQLVISYTGALIENRDATLLFQGIAELIAEGQVKANDFRFEYAGVAVCFRRLVQDAGQYGLENILVDRGYVPHIKALELQKNSDALLLLTWNTIKETGIMTGKFLEYIGVNRPILALITGDNKASEVARIIDDLQLGKCIFYMDGDLAKLELKNFLMEQLNQKRRSGYVPVEHDPRVEALFSYPRIVRRLLSFL